MSRTSHWFRSSIHLLAALGALALAPGCVGSSDEDESEEFVPPEEKLAGETNQALSSGLPRFNEVARKGSHNSYVTGRWVNEEIGASGTAEPLADQLFHEHIRDIELDLQRDHDTAGHFLVRHSYNKVDPGLAAAVGAAASLGGSVAGGAGAPLPPVLPDPVLSAIIAAFGLPAALDGISSDNTQCRRLVDCLQILRKFDYALPYHEATVVHIELKEMNFFTQARRVFDATHSAADLDATLWEQLGPRLYTPREMLARPGCQSKTLRQCVKDAGWPTVDELRGRYLVTVQANWGDNYWDWLDYASGDVATHAAFPMREYLSKQVTALPPEVGAKMAGCPDHEPWLEISGDSLSTNTGHPNIADVACQPWYVDAITRARDASVFAGALGPSDPVTAQLHADNVILRSDSSTTTAAPAEQIAFAAAGFQLITSDQPWAFAGDAAGLTPTNPANATFALATLAPEPALQEPGARLYFHLAGLADPFAYAAMTLPMGASTNDNWEVQPSTTRGPIPANFAEKLGGLGAPAANPAVPGQGCLFAATPDHRSEVRICRDTRDENGELDGRLDTWLTRTVIRPGEAPQITRSKLPHGTTSPAIGGLLRLALNRSASGGAVTTTVWAMTAGEMGENGQPVWWSVIPQVFSADLSLQGIYGSNDVEMVNLKHNGNEIPAAALSTPIPARLVDLSVQPFGETTWKGTKSVLWSQTGKAYVGVHRSAGTRNGAGRHLYTTDLYEARTAGVNAEAEGYFYLGRDPGMPGTTALFKARVGPKNLLSTAPDCGLAPDAASMMCGNRVGYIATSQLAGTTPLYELALHSDDYWNAGDYLYTISPAEVGSAVALGYVNQGVIGYVWTGGTLDGLPFQAGCNGMAPQPGYCTAKLFNASTSRDVDEGSVAPHEEHWYAFQVPSSGIAEAYLNIVGTEDVDLALFANPTGGSVSNSYGYSNVELVRASLPAASWAYLRVRSYSSYPAFVRLRLSEQGAQASESASLAPGSYGFPDLYQPARFRIDANEADWYRVSPSGGISQITVQFNHPAGDIEMALYSWTGALVAASTGVTSSETLAIPVALSGPHYLKVYGYQGAVNDYSMIVAPQ